VISATFKYSLAAPVGAFTVTVISSATGVTVVTEPTVHIPVTES